MFGAIIGDIVGSRFEFNNTKDFNFDLFTKQNSFTDDTICTMAIADALLTGESYKDSLLRWCRQYPNPMGAYGGSFGRWIWSNDNSPYNSFGNGSAMRVSPVAWWFETLDEVLLHAELTALPTHDHEEGVKGAQATAAAIFLARKYGKKEALLTASQYYPTWVEPLLGQNKFDETCQGTMPVVFGIINKANSYEEAIRYAVAVGGDSDTIAAIVGSIAEAIWDIPKSIYTVATGYLDTQMNETIYRFYNALNNRNKKSYE